EQIELYKSASKASLREASQKIAKYYASRDKKKSQDPLREVYNYSLHIKFFKEFEDAYIEYARFEENG
ncbi:MAG: hypothetical protein HYZ42_04905, partial [Bacteroidetes bacterium]|nr:hypothetical protein [Bacteroidota bacterium]